MGQKEEILRKVRKEVLFRLASPVSNEMVGDISTRTQLTRIIKSSMSLEEIKRKLRQYQASRKQRILPVLVISIVVFSSLTTGLALTLSFPDNKTNLLSSVEWSKTYENTNFDQTLILQRASDSGYVLAAGVYAEGALVTTWIEKVDEAGNPEWKLSISQVFPNNPCSIQPTSDQGYIIAGNTYDNAYGSYPWLIKTDSRGTIQWGRTYREDYYEFATFAQQTLDGGYVVAGVRMDMDMYRGWLLRTDENGSLKQREEHEELYSLDYQYEYKCYCSQRTSDNGSIIASTKWGYLIHLVKLNSSGEITSIMDYSPFNAYYFTRSVAPTFDGGYIVAGYTSEYSVIGRHLFIVKIDAMGVIQWSKTYGDYAYDIGSIQQTSDNGYVLAGRTSYTYNGRDDAWLMRIDEDGKSLWNKTYGGAEDDQAQYVLQTPEGRFLFAGITKSDGTSRLWLESVYGSTSIMPSSRPLLFAVTILSGCLLAVVCAGILFRKKLLKEYHPSNSGAR
ncbi:MAG: hypothetical protein WED04_11825 [Promethearchaeati archaeon SRVP18_Atabeyarchaeia-1]